MEGDEMPDQITRETVTYEEPHDTVVVDRDNGSSLGTILGIVIVLIVLAAIWWFALGPGTSTTTNVNINNPPAAPGATQGGGNPPQSSPVLVPSEPASS
jgi:hypothetical protein